MHRSHLRRETRRPSKAQREYPKARESRRTILPCLFQNLERKLQRPDQSPPESSPRRSARALSSGEWLLLKLQYKTVPLFSLVSSLYARRTLGLLRSRVHLTPESGLCEGE